MTKKFISNSSKGVRVLKSNFMEAASKLAIMGECFQFGL